MIKQKLQGSPHSGPYFFWMPSAWLPLRPYQMPNSGQPCVSQLMTLFTYFPRRDSCKLLGKQKLIQRFCLAYFSPGHFHQIGEHRPLTLSWLCASTQYTLLSNAHPAGETVKKIGTMMPTKFKPRVPLGRRLEVLCTEEH